MSSLYERLGGDTAVMAAVDLFYEKVLDDALLAPFFVGLDMRAQTAKQIAFMARAFGGPVVMQGRDLRAAHARLVQERGLGDAHFDAVAGHLDSTLRELGLGDEIIAEVLAIVGATRSQVLAG